MSALPVAPAGQERVIRVFVSSTLRGMQVERDELAKLSSCDFDLRLGVMTRTRQKPRPADLSGRDPRVPALLPWPPGPADDRVSVSNAGSSWCSPRSPAR